MAKVFMEQTGFVFVPPYNPGNLPQITGSAQEQLLRTEKFQQNQALFCNYTAVDGYLKKQIVTSMEPVFLYPMVD